MVLLLISISRLRNGSVRLTALRLCGSLRDMSLSLQEIKKEIHALPRELKRELTSDLIEEISAEDFPVSAGMLDEVERRMEEYRRDPSKVTTLGEIEARIRDRKNRA